ncbi:carbohydrate ABC transporter membrane protein 1 (CUT1 family) [Lacrimispora xylanisolvens]|uniref:Carbohydrate ABC transporter membrane protein 1 (CUT1 family) n=1 Tax=Lacrimispora xylanisolvens TaxID=384636 RepID=A0A2S6HWI2_9FIRM|nr:ABC transporter permease subunit [Hungatella xylanolytica]MBE5988159.1 sugar ABC transporter permease [Paenibacillaceae bacterium]PPK82362.1 carbohydrate ABC transporter membrane protein 1 (CUT1 family) [Hungatella xylanolytica]
MNKKMKGPAAYAAGENKRPLLVSLHYYRGFYVMFLPVLIFALVFHYLPMLGIRYAFYSYKGIKEPVFIGLAHFEKMMNMPGFWSAFGNTIVLSIVKLLLNTIMAVVLSLMLNELRSATFKKITQTIVYLPHFMSWVVTASVFSLILSPTGAGLLNAVLIRLGILNEGIYYLGSQNWWRPMYYVINVWKDTGWGTIIFMATLSGINPELYEAASMDGAGRFNRLRYITMPALNNTIITVLILNLAKVMNLFESVFVMQNDAVRQQADVLQTYIYTQTFNSGALPDYGYTTAVGLISSLVGCFLVLLCNKASYKVRGRGIV